MTGSDKSKFAAIDCGTNSTRLLIADAFGNRFVEELRMTRLGEGVHAQRRLSEAAIERTVGALREYRALLDAQGVSRFRAVATSAARDAANADEFMRVSSEVLGQALEVISGDEEAALTYLGASPQEAGINVVVDIGGGSTEFVFGENNAITHARSLDIGSVRMAGLFLHGDPPLAAEVDAVVDYVQREMRSVIKPPQSATLTAVAGTATSLASMDLGLRNWDFDKVDGHVMTKERVVELRDVLLAMTTFERTQETGMPHGRAEVVAGGAIILVEAMRILGVSRTLVSARDILDGAIVRLAGDRYRL